MLTIIEITKLQKKKNINNIITKNVTIRFSYFSNSDEYTILR